MQIVIDIPEEEYTRWVTDGEIDAFIVRDALRNGTPLPKGRWIDGKCNRCGTHAPFWAMASAYYCSKYCPNCGAKMAESEDAE